jgi:6-phosphogluconolactonase
MSSDLTSRALSPAMVIAADVPRLVAAAASAIADAAARALAARGRFRIALAGGSTPRALYPALVDAIDWTRTGVFFGDERAVPPDHPDSNYRMARETLLGPAGVPRENVVRWRAEDPDLDAAARDYASALAAAGGPPYLDLALQGLGPDGHTASLFPGTAALSETERLAVAVEVPGKGARLTLTYPALLGAREIYFLVTGADKAPALAAVLRAGSDLPAARVVQGPVPVTIFCDASAARALDPGRTRKPDEVT